MSCRTWTNGRPSTRLRPLRAGQSSLTGSPPLRTRFLLLLLAVLALPAASLKAEEAFVEPPELDLPIACDMQDDCFIQHYFDYAPGPEARDHTCGIQTYDGHQGLDFAVPSPAWREEGVPVIAAAPGYVELTVNDIPDRPLSKQEVRDFQSSPLKESNSVIIDHGNGWRTHYGHLRQNSILVKRGDKVAAGNLLGLVGLSGSTNFPHLHFYLSYNKKIIDPFTGLTGNEGCLAPPVMSFWSKAALAQLPYRDSEISSAGFTMEQPNLQEYDKLPKSVKVYPVDTKKFFFWVKLWAARNGDVIVRETTTPGGATDRHEQIIADEKLIRLHSYSYYYANGTPLPAGPYMVRFEIRRGDTNELIDSVEKRMEILSPETDAPEEPQ